MAGHPPSYLAELWGCYKVTNCSRTVHLQHIVIVERFREGVLSNATHRTGRIEGMVLRATKIRRGALHCAIASVFSLALGLAALAQPPKEKEIPFEKSSAFGLILVRAEANGRPVVLIVDTASDHTILSSELLGVLPRSANNAAFTSKGSGFRGAGVFAITTLKVGPFTWRDRRVVAMDLHELSKSLGQKIDGLLGIDFFSDFEVVAVDLKNRKLILKP